MIVLFLLIGAFVLFIYGAFSEPYSRFAHGAAGVLVILAIVAGGAGASALPN